MSRCHESNLARRDNYLYKFCMASLLFDLDGTLADTAPDLHAAMNYVLAQFDHEPIDVSNIKHMIGGGARAILRRGFAARGAAPDDKMLDHATALFIDYYDANIDAGTIIYPHLLDVLVAAKAADIKLAVITNKRESLAAKLLFRLNLHGFFEVLIGGDTLPQRKPHPAPIHEALRRLQTAPHDAIMIGDSEADCDSARAAQIASICVSFGYPLSSVGELAADAIIDDYAALPSAVKKLKPKIFDAL